MILVAGGTGTLGARVVPLLAARGDLVRVLTRDPRRADHLRGPGIETVTGDVRDPVVVAAATHGCSSLVSAVHGFAGPGRPSPASTDRDGNHTLIRAATNAGIEHVVLVSVLGAAPDHPMSLNRMKYAAEQDLIGSGLDWTIIRPAPFLETWIALIGAKIADRQQALVFGAGHNPINFVSVRDVATAVEHGVYDLALRSKTIDVGGPDNLTFNQIADHLIAASGKPGRTRHIPLAMLRALSVLARPVSPGFARQARAAVVMNTTDMTLDQFSIRTRLPDIAATTFDEVLHDDAKPPPGT